MEYFEKLRTVLDGIDVESVINVKDSILRCYNQSNNVYIFGNGGSGATASHVAGDYLKTIKVQANKSLRIHCLNDNSTQFSAIANDIDYNEVFREQLKGSLMAQDLVIGISGSGNSQNIINAIQYANTIGALTIGACGFDGGILKKITKLSLHIEIADMEIVEDLHLSCFHAIKKLLMEEIQQQILHTK